MSHNVSYYWFGRTQYIPRFGGNLQECGDFTWRVSDCEELVAHIKIHNGVGESSCHSGLGLAI